MKQRVHEVDFKFEFLPPLFHPGKCQQILGEACQALCIVTNDTEEAHVVGRIGHGSVDQGLCVPLNGGQRRTQFMRHVNHEIFADTFEFFELGVLMLQLRDGLLQVSGGFVERAAPAARTRSNRYPADGRENFRVPVRRRAT